MGKRVMSSGYDMSSSTMARISRHYFLSRLIPMGMYRGGAGVKCILVLLATRYLGRPVFWLATRFELQAARLYRIKDRFPF